MEPRDLAGQGASRMSISHKVLNMPSGGGLRRKPSVATTAGSVREPPLTVPPRAYIAINPASTPGALHQRQQPPAHITLPPPSESAVTKHSSHLQPTGITPLVEQVEQIAKVVEPTLPSTITTDDFTRAVA